MPTTQLDKLVTRAMDQANIPGLALALVQGDRVVVNGVWGVQDSASQTPLRRHTHFQAASLSKPIFAYLVMQLVAAGRLELDTPLINYWHDTSIDDPRLPLITARHALSHTTGFPNWRAEQLSTAWAPGQRFGYSGEGYEYLQRVVEHITGRPLHLEVWSQVLEPLGMHNSTFAWAVDEAGEFVLDNHGAIMPATGMAASSAAFSLLSTASDYARFVHAMLNPPSDHPRLLATTTIQTMLAPQIRVGSSTQLFWALGWGIQRTTWGDAFWHWGGAQNGYMNYVVGFPQRRHGVVIMTNSENGLQICETLASAAFGAHVAQPAFGWLLPFENWTAAPD